MLYMGSRKESRSCLFDRFKGSYRVGCASQTSEGRGPGRSLASLHPDTTLRPKSVGYDVELVGDQGPVKDVGLGSRGESAKISVSAIQVNANNPIEDRLLIQQMRMHLPGGGSKDFLLTAVIDGHGGWQVAEYVQTNFTRIFQRELSQYVSSLEKKEGCKDDHHRESGSDVAETDLIAGLFYSLRKTYYLLDEELRAKLEVAYSLGFSKLASVGACITVSVVTEDAILTANSGDCLSVYCNENGVWLPMNEQLSAMNPQEQKRLEEAHKHEKDSLIQCKQVLQDKFLMGLYTVPRYKGCYVKGILQPSRAIGDFRLKSMDFNYNWEKDLSTERLMPTFSYVLQDGESSPYSYNLVNGDKAISLKRDSRRYFVKNPLSFPYVRSEPMLHLLFYNSANKRLSSTSNTSVEMISPREYCLTPAHTNSSLRIECVTPEYRYLPLSEHVSSNEFFKDFTLSKLRNAYSYFQGSLDPSKRSFLVLGTDGVWDFLTPKDAASIILSSKSPEDGTRKILKKVLNSAGVNSVEQLNSLAKKRKVFDDTSIILAEITPGNHSSA